MSETPFDTPFDNPNSGRIGYLPGEDAPDVLKEEASDELDDANASRYKIGAQPETGPYSKEQSGPAVLRNPSQGLEDLSASEALPNSKDQ